MANLEFGQDRLAQPLAVTVRRARDIPHYVIHLMIIYTGRSRHELLMFGGIFTLPPSGPVRVPAGYAF